MKRYAILYLVTLLVIIPLDFLFLGVIAKPFFKAQVGDMLGDLNILPAAIFYPLYTLGVLIFVTGAPNASIQSSLVYGALFGLFAYATFDLTALATLKHWTWPAAFADVSWGAAVTAIAATAGLAAADRVKQKDAARVASSNLKPHGEEARSAVSNHEGTDSRGLILRDASLRDAPQD